MPAVQRKEPVTAGGRTHGKRHQGDVRFGHRRWPERHRLPANDLIAHFKPGAADSTFADFRRELERLLASLLPKGRA